MKKTVSIRLSGRSISAKAGGYPSILISEVKLGGPEKSILPDADIAFQESEYQRLRGELQSAHDASKLPEAPDEKSRASLNELLIRLRTRSF